MANLKPDMRAKLKRELNTLEPRMCPLLYKFIKRTLPLQTKELKSIIAIARDNINFCDFIAEYVQKKDSLDLDVNDFASLQTVTLLDYEEYLTDVRNNSLDTQARKVSSIKKFMKFLHAEEVVKNNITLEWRVKKTDTSKIHNKLDSSEVQDMISCILNGDNTSSVREEKAHDKYGLRDATIFILLSYTAIRISELVSLDIDNINLRNCYISVARKGNKIQEIPYPSYVSEILNTYVEIRRKRTDVPTEYKDALFISSHKRRLTEQSVRKLLNKYKDRTDITEKITCHTLRRTCLSAFYNATGDIRATQKLAGHSSPAVTAKYYADVDDARFRDMISKFNY